MNDMGEALGTATEGGLLARVLGRRQSAVAARTETGGDCLNCGTVLQGNFCHSCGQKAHIHRTISGIMHDLIHGVLHLDGKLWNTLPLLAFRPGWLTRDYIDGKRARYVSPMAMFLFSVFLMFAVFQALGITTPTSLGGDGQLEQATAEARADRDRLEAEIAALPPESAERAAKEEDLAALDRTLDGVDTAFGLGNLGDSTNLDINLTGNEAFDSKLLAKWRENPGLMLYKLQNNSYKFSWALIPLSVPFVWLLFLWRRQFKAYDHAIFVTYSLAFMSLLFIVLSLLGAAGVGLNVLGVAGLLIPPVHLYKQLRGTYGLSRFSALWRWAALSLFIWIVVILFLQLLLLLGAF